jgi:hypothetical protein
LVDRGPGAPRALSPSIDHIVPLSRGGQHVKANVRIAHLWCNVEKNNSDDPSPEYMRARLSQIMDGTPIPEELYRSCFAPSRWRVRRRRRVRRRLEYMIALYIAVGRVAADPRYGEPTTRLADAARRLTGDAAEERMRRGLDGMRTVVQRRAQIDARWRSAR